MSINRVVLTGRLTKDVELRATPSGNNVASFTIAVDGYGKDENGKRTTYFFECESWDDLGKRLWENLRKGDRIALNGYLVQYKFERRDGTAGSAVKIVATSVDFLSPKHEENKVEENPLETTPEEIKDEDVPF